MQISPSGVILCRFLMDNRERPHLFPWPQCLWPPLGIVMATPVSPTGVFPGLWALLRMIRDVILGGT